MTTETLNMKTVSLSRVIKQIKFQLMNEDYTPIVVIGKSGVGKTESMADLAKELNIGFVELRLSHYQESDLIGLPYITSDNRTSHAMTELFPDSSDKGQGILLLDEITSSQKSMRSAVYQLTDSSRKLGQYKLPDRWLVVCCGNGPEDGGDFRGMEPALLSRGRCMRVEEDLDAWKDWAIKKGVHPTVVAFLSFMPDNLHVMDLDRPNDMIACPRNWVKLSTQLTNMEKMAGGVITDDDDLEFATCCCVGERCGPNFVGFYRYNKSVINAGDILEGSLSWTSVKGVDTEVMYIVIQNLIALISKEMKGTGKAGFSDSTVKRCANVCNWLIDVGRNIKLDFAIMALQDLVNHVTEFKSLVLSDAFDVACPNLLSFATENRVVFKS